MRKIDPLTARFAIKVIMVLAILASTTALNAIKRTIPVPSVGCGPSGTLIFGIYCGECIYDCAEEAETIYGCPDCRDGCGIYVEHINPATRRSKKFWLDHEASAKEITDYAGMVADRITTLRRRWMGKE